MTDVTDQILEELSLAIQAASSNLRESTVHLRACSQNAAESEVVKYYNQLFSEVTMYRLHLYPKSVTLIEGVKEMLENYTLLEFEDFKEILDEIREKCQEDGKLAGKLQIAHSIVLSNLEKLKQQMTAKGIALTHTATELDRKATGKEDVGNGLKFLGVAAGLINPVIGFALAGVGHAIHSGAKDDYRRADNMRDSISKLEQLNESLECVSTAINVVGRFMGLMKSELDGVARAGGSSTFSKVHWKKMSAKARGIIGNCNQFIAMKTDIETGFLAIPKNITVKKEYEETWCKNLIE